MSNKYNFISKIKIVNNNSNKIHNLITSRINNQNSKTKKKGKIFIKSLISRKDVNSNKTSTNSTNKTHKNIISNIEDYNNLVKLNINNKLKKDSGNKNIHRRINTVKINFNINNTKKRNRNHFVLINTRNTKINNELSFIAQYFQTENSKDFTNHKSIYNINNSLTINLIQ